MNIHKCDRCGKILEPKKTTYYSVQEISCRIPGHPYVRVHTSHGESSEYQAKTKESWVDYCDLDFCESCFKKESIYDFVKQQSKDMEI